MSKILIGACAVLASMLLFLFLRYLYVVKDLENERYKNLTLEASLKTQNEAISKLKIDTENFKKSWEAQELELKSKYDKILKENKNLSYLANIKLDSTNNLSCKKELESYKEAVKTSISLLDTMLQKK